MRGVCSGRIWRGCRGAGARGVAEGCKGLEEVKAVMGGRGRMESLSVGGYGVGVLVEKPN